MDSLSSHQIIDYQNSGLIFEEHKAFGSVRFELGTSSVHKSVLILCLRTFTTVLHPNSCRRSKLCILSVTFKSHYCSHLNRVTMSVYCSIYLFPYILVKPVQANQSWLCFLTSTFIGFIENCTKNKHRFVGLKISLIRQGKYLSIDHLYV